MGLAPTSSGQFSPESVPLSDTTRLKALCTGFHRDSCFNESHSVSFCTATHLTPTTPISSLVANLTEQADYPETGVRNKPLHKDEQTQHSLMCLAAGTTIAEHTSPRNVTVMVVAGQGTLTLEGREIRLQPGVFVLMLANAPHALQTTNSTLAFLLDKW